MKSFLTKLIIKYRVVVFKKESLEKLGTFYINRLYIIGIVCLIFLASFFFACLLLFVSPLGNSFFDYSKKHEIEELSLHVDSIGKLLDLQLNYTENLKLIFNEHDSLKNSSSENVVFSLNSLKSKITKQDSSLLEYIRKLDEKSVSFYNKNILEKLNLTPPTKGVVTSSFNIEDGHFGVDVAAKKNTKVFAVLNGVVLFSDYSEDFGNFLVLAHENNFLSIYLHNSTLLKKRGDLVSVGEAIALIGSSGSLSSAPHLHFEFWHGTTPINPEKYLQFH